MTQRPSEETPGCNCDRWGQPFAVHKENQGATILRASKNKLKRADCWLQKVSDQLEMSKPAPQTVLNSQ